MPKDARTTPSTAKAADQQNEEAARRDGMIDKLLDGTEFGSGLARIE